MKTQCQSCGMEFELEMLIDKPPTELPSEFDRWIESDFWIFMQYDSFQDYGGDFYNNWFSKFMNFEKRQLTAMVDKL